MSEQNYPMASELCARFGCGSCKAQVNDDPFLANHERYWCKKQNKSFTKSENPSQNCVDWSFCGDKELVKLIFADMNPSLPFEEE